MKKDRKKSTTEKGEKKVENTRPLAVAILNHYATLLGENFAVKPREFLGGRRRI